MKSIPLYIYLLGVMFTFISCEKDLPTQQDFDAYSFSDIDIDGGEWKPILLTSVEQVSIDAPSSISSPEYINEIKALKEAISKINGEDKSVIKNWGNNPVIRWNEIARELVAKYNLLPAPNADGTYPSPDASNPSVYPFFPISHPPYASRAYAYLGAAQFDALISAWHYKKKYNRPALHKSDQTIDQTFPNSNIASFPSDGAVIAAVSRDILSAMFPLEKEYLKKKSDEMSRCLLLSGINVESDIIAGDSLGRGVAKIFLARASADGMKNAQVSKVVSDSIALAAFNKFGWKWQNMESPARPVGLAPGFGKVKLWSLPNVELTRPPVPPSPGSEKYKESETELINLSKNLTKEQRAIANFWSDGTSTTTPPGHWNKFACEFIVKYKLNPLRSARVYAYMNMAIMDAGVSCWDAKYFYYYPRPIQTIPGIKTILGTPNFPGYTSGHSTFSAAAASVLAYIFPIEKTKVDNWAQEAAESRIYGGIHFRWDAEEGIIQGKKVAEYTIMKAQVDGAK